MSKLTAALMSSAAHLSEPKPSQSTKIPVKPVQRARLAAARAASIIESSSAANQVGRNERRQWRGRIRRTGPGPHSL